MSLSPLFRKPIVSGFATALLAVIFLFQACASYASPLPANMSAPAGIASGSCCDTPSQPGCSDLNAAEASDVCARHCAQPGHTAPSQTAVPASGVPVYGSDIYTGKIVFLAQRPTLSLAPRAISGTPLIYHLQRLLN